MSIFNSLLDYTWKRKKKSTGKVIMELVSGTLEADTSTTGPLSVSERKGWGWEEHKVSGLR